MSRDSSHLTAAERDEDGDQVSGDGPESHPDPGHGHAGAGQSRPKSPALKLTLSVSATGGLKIPAVDDDDLGRWGLEDKVEGLMVAEAVRLSSLNSMQQVPSQPGSLNASAARPPRQVPASLPTTPQAVPPSGNATPLAGSQEISFDMIQLIPPVSGLVWRSVDAAQVVGCRELSNPELSAALATKTDFTNQEWDAFRIHDLRVNDFVKAGDSYFAPASSDGGAAPNALATDCFFQQSKHPEGEQEQMPDATTTIAADIAKAASHLNTVEMLAQNATAVQVRGLSTVKVVWSPAPAADTAPWLRHPPSSVSRGRIRPSSCAPRVQSPPNLRASTPTDLKELFSSPMADRASGKTLPRPFSHIGNRRDMGTSLHPSTSDYIVATRRRARTPTPVHRSAEHVHVGGGNNPGSMLVEKLRVPGPKEASKRRPEVPRAVSPSRSRTSGGEWPVVHYSSSNSSSKLTLHLPETCVTDGAPSPLREYSAEAGEVIREYSAEPSSENSEKCLSHAPGTRSSASRDAASAIEIELARTFQTGSASSGVQTCKSVQLAAKKCARLRRGAAKLVTKETDTSGGVYGFLKRHSADIPQLLDADISELLPQYLKEARVSRPSGTRKELRTGGGERSFDPRKNAGNRLHATSRDNEQPSDAGSPMSRSVSGVHTPLNSAKSSTPAARKPHLLMRGGRGSFAQVDPSGGGIGNVLGAVGYITSGHGSPFSSLGGFDEADVDIPPAYDTLQAPCHDQHLQVRQVSALLIGEQEGNRGGAGGAGGKKGGRGEVLKEWSGEDEDTSQIEAAGNTSVESHLSAEGSQYFDASANRGKQFISEVKALLEHGSAFQSPADKKRSLSSNLARRLHEQRRLQNAAHTQPVSRSSPSHHSGQRFRGV